MTATPHDHRTHVPGCFRCELSADEVTTTPARDALRHLLVDYYANADLLDHEVIDLTVEALLCPEEHNDVVAALVESGWRPTADQLRAMGGESHVLRRDPRGVILTQVWRFPEGVDGD